MLSHVLIELQSHFCHIQGLAHNSEYIFEQVIIINAHNQLESCPDIEQSNDKRIPFKSFPNWWDILGDVSCTNECNCACCIVLQEWCHHFLVNDIQQCDHVINPIKLVMTLQQHCLHHIPLGNTTLNPLLQQAFKS